MRNRLTRTFKGSSATPQCFTDFHQNASQHVLAAAVAAVSPVVIVLGVLDELRLARPEQQGPKFLVLAELGQYRLPHDADLDGLPVRAELLLATPAKTRGQHRRIGLADLLAVALILKLLGLEIVFRSRPDLAVEADGM